MNKIDTNRSDEVEGPNFLPDMKGALNKLARLVMLMLGCIKEDK
jgi:hypothetical protein